MQGEHEVVDRGCWNSTVKGGNCVNGEKEGQLTGGIYCCDTNLCNKSAYLHSCSTFLTSFLIYHIFCYFKF